MAEMGGDARVINPLQPVELVIDHSVQVDYFCKRRRACEEHDLEFERNRERYAFLKWGQSALQDFRVVPPGTGIVHQVNIEYLARVVFGAANASEERALAYPDTAVGTDSHTTMVNGLGVLAWGVGGIEAEAAMLGQPVTMLIPEVVGFRLDGALREGVTATDLVLTVAEMLRRKGVVGKFVEFYGKGSRRCRSSIARRSATCRRSSVRRSRSFRSTIARSSIFASPAAPRSRSRSSKPMRKRRDSSEPTHRPIRSLPIRLRSISQRSSRASPGPRRPQDRVPLHDVKRFVSRGDAGVGGGARARRTARSRASKTKAAVERRRSRRRPRRELYDGSVVIAAITSCTNTSNPSVLIGAGLLARNAVERGLETQPWVKTSLAPGSKVVTDYLEKAGLREYLDRLGFNLVGYGCTTCIGNSGPLPERRRRSRRRRRSDRRGGALGKSQLRGTHPSASSRELSRVAAAGRRLRARRTNRS